MSLVIIPQVEDEFKKLEKTISVQNIPASDGLDSVEVIWQDYAPGRGRATFICYGTAWTAYFSGMGDRTIKKFIADCGVDYLIPKFRMNEFYWLKQTGLSHYDRYLERVINAVKKEIRQ